MTSPSPTTNVKKSTTPKDRSPSQQIPNFVGQYYETSTFHHLSTWRLQYQRLVAQLNLEKGPEFQPNDTSDSSSAASDVNISRITGDSNSSGPFTDDTKRQTTTDGTSESSGLDSSIDGVPFSNGSPLMDRTVYTDQVFLHLDMDAFYASVMINRRYPHLKNLPVAVCPAKASTNGTSEVASANYIARDLGIRARMFIVEARKLCPDLVVINCDYALVEDTSARMYEQILRYTHQVEAVSADEAFLDISNWGFQRAMHLAERIKQDVSTATQCPCSIGIGTNKLIARLATEKAKPNGIFMVSPLDSAEFVKPFTAKELPGIGPAIQKKLEDKQIFTIADLERISKSQLQSWFGPKIGETMYGYARGMDSRPLKLDHERKTVGAQISWGIRMSSMEQVSEFLSELSAEVCRRLESLSSMGSKITLRVLKKRNIFEEDLGTVDAKMGGVSEDLAAQIPKGESAKLFNPGNCTQISKSSKLSMASAEPKVIAAEIIRLFKVLNVPPSDLRGAGISVDDLESSKPTSRQPTLDAFISTQTSIKQASSIECKTDTAIELRLPPSQGHKRGYAEVGGAPEEAMQSSPKKAKLSQSKPLPKTSISAPKQMKITSMWKVK